MSLMITNPEFTVFTCLLIDKINTSAEKHQIMIILNTTEVKIFKLIKSNACIDEKVSITKKLFTLFMIIFISVQIKQLISFRILIY